MRSMRIVAVCSAVATVVAMTVVSVSYASQPELTMGRMSSNGSFGPAPTFSVLAGEHSSVANELAVLTRQGISPKRAYQALQLQGEVANTHLVEKISAALAGAYAGAWFDPPAAKLDVGVTSNASRQVVRRIAAQTDLAADVVETPVRSTTAELVATQSRWNSRLSKLLARREAVTGIDSVHNAVSVKIGSSIPSTERTALEHGAATAGVNIHIKTLPSPHLRARDEAKKNCKSPFVVEEAYCEEAITAGVTIKVLKVGSTSTCTAGPILIEGNETYMLTAGHCFGEKGPEAGASIEVKVFSRYVGGVELEIGNEGFFYINKNRDMAMVKVNRSLGNFTEPLPDPVPALVTEWVEKPKTPHAVEGIKEAALDVPRQVVCHEGQTTGEKCGQVIALNTSSGNEPTAHLVTTNACSDEGDSGGPYFFRMPSTGVILMMGAHVAGTKCVEPLEADFEPLLDIEGGANFGILSTFTGKSLLTSDNETRPSAETTLLAEWLANGNAIAAALAVETTTEFLLEDTSTVAGKEAVLCNGILDGTVGPNGEDLVEKLLNLAKEETVLLALALLGTGAGSDCVTVSACAEGSVSSPIEVWAKGLPWSTLLFLRETGAIADLITGEGYEFLCLVLGVNSEDSCEATESQFTVLNDPISGDATMPAGQARLPFAKCSGGGAETGAFETDTTATMALTSGELLTVSSE